MLCKSVVIQIMAPLKKNKESNIHATIKYE